MSKIPPAVCHYFVDEAGDLAVFGRKGRVLLGTPGVSDTFMIGLCDLPDPAEVTRQLDDLRASLLADPYFKGVPSLQPEARKTALAFHAKNDLAEVRREVFKLIPALNPKIVVSVRRKSALARLRNLGIRVGQNELYDDTLKQTCRNMLHRGERIQVMIARRGNNSRQEALKAALLNARDGFNKRWQSDHQQPIDMRVGVPSDHAGLQVTDYLLWALQRMYESGEDRFFESVADCFSMVHDRDDTRGKPYGRMYTRADQPTPKKLLPLATG